MCALGERTFYRAKVWGERVLTSGGALLRTTVCFLLVGVVWAWVVSLAGHPAGGGTFLFRQESTQRRGLLGRRWGRAFLACGSRGLGGPSRSRPPLRTPPGTLRVSLQGESLGVIIFDPSPKGIPHLFTTASSPDTLRVSLLRGVWGERVLTSGGALLRTTVVFGDRIADHFPLSTVNCPLSTVHFPPPTGPRWVENLRYVHYFLVGYRNIRG